MKQQMWDSEIVFSQNSPLAHIKYYPENCPNYCQHNINEKNFLHKPS